MDVKTKENLFLHDETRKYFLKKFGKWRKASAAKVRRHYDALDCSDLLTIARLNHYAGIVFLEQENPVEAEKFLEKSIVLYERCSKASSKGLSGDTRLDVNQAKVYLALSWIRNYHRLEEADEILSEIYESSQNKLLSEKDNINASLAHIALLESALLVELSGKMYRKPEDLFVFPNGCDVLPPREELEGVLVVEKCVLVYDYAVRFGQGHLMAEMMGAIKNLFRRKPDHKFLLVKALMRRASLDVYLPVQPISGTFVEEVLVEVSKEEGSSCVHACILFTIGLLMYLSVETVGEAGSCFERCFNIRKKLLGEKHLDTVRAQFWQNYVMAPTSLAANQNRMTVVANALDIFRKHASGKFWFLTDSLQYYSKCLSDEGKFKESETVLKEAIELEIVFKGGDNNLNVAARKLELGKLYLYFQKWQSIVDSCLPVVNDVVFRSSEDPCVADALGSSAYAFYKLGKNGEAKDYFARAIRIIDACDNKEHPDWAITKACILGFKLEFEFVAMKRIDVAKNDFNNANKLMQFAKKFRTSRFLETQAYRQLGFYYEFVEQSLTRAIECYLNSLNVASLKHIEINPYNCDSSLAIARVYFKQSKFREGEDLLKLTFKQACSLFDKDAPCFEACFDLFQQNLCLQKTVKQAHGVFIKAMKVFTEQKFPESSHLVANFGYNFAKRIYDEDFAIIGLKGCQELLIKSLKVFKKAHGAKDKQSAQCERILGLLYLKKQDIRNAEWHLRNAALVLQ